MKHSLFVLTLISLIANADSEIPSGQKNEALIGSGYYTQTEKFVGSCVAGIEDKAGQPRSNIDFSQTVSRDQLSKELGFDSGGKLRYGAADFSAAAKFLKASTSNAFSITMVYSGDYKFRNTILKNPVLSELGKTVQVDTEKFKQTCGDEFVEQIIQGAKLFFTIRIDFSSREEKDTFEASFSYKSSFASAHASIKNMSKSFSQNTSVTVSAFQMGGKIDQITGIFQGTSGDDNQSLGFIQCTLGDFKKCDQVLANALSYATDRTKGFPSQLIKADNESNGGPANLSYLTKSYLTAGIYSLYPQEVGEAIQAARHDLEATFDESLSYLTKARYFLNDGHVLLSTRQRSLLVKEEDKLSKNVQKIVRTAMTCYNEPLKCIDAVAALNPQNPGGLSKIDESSFVINPESFRQYCELSHTVVATPELKKSVYGMIDTAKSLAPNRFISMDNQPVDECLISHLVFQEVDTISFKQKGISTLLPLSEYKHWKQLDISENEISDLKPISGFSSLNYLNAAHNMIKEITPLIELSNLQTLDLSFNHLREAQELSSIRSLRRLDLRDNFPGIECPKSTSINTCLVAPVDIYGQISDLGKLLPSGALEPAASEIGKGNFLVTGLVDGIPGSYSSAVIYNKETRSFNLTGNMNYSRRGHSSTSLSDGRVLISGGWGSAITKLEIFNPHDYSFKLLPSGTVVGHIGHTSTLLKDGRILIAGGYSQGQIWTGQGAGYTAEIFDPKTEKVIKTISMKAPRAWHTATLLNDGTVLFVGGAASDSASANAEIYDPSTDSFTWTQNAMKVPRGAHTATLLNDGRVLIAGGYVNAIEATDTAELFDPKTNRFTFLQNKLIQNRAHHTASLLINGKVLFAGGRKNIISFDTFSDSCESCIKTVEVFDPAETSFRELPLYLTHGRSHHLAIPLSIDSILFLGGPYWNSTSQVDMFIYSIDK